MFHSICKIFRLNTWVFVRNNLLMMSDACIWYSCNGDIFLGVLVQVNSQYLLATTGPTFVQKTFVCFGKNLPAILVLKVTLSYYHFLADSWVQNKWFEPTHFAGGAWDAQSGAKNWAYVLSSWSIRSDLPMSKKHPLKQHIQMLAPHPIPSTSSFGETGETWCSEIHRNPRTPMASFLLSSVSLFNFINSAWAPMEPTVARHHIGVCIRGAPWNSGHVWSFNPKSCPKPHHHMIRRI